MTKINRITIHGFKSFAHKTDIPFDDKFNCILGPNGSGKSNIGDALCFVLGRLSSKSLRAEKAANLVFNGGKGKKASNSGSVEIAFCNKSNIFPVESKEVVVNRTIKNNGTSVYRINGKRKTRSEVLDLMGAAKINPEGYNIVLQGDITHFVDMPPIERRKIIEEISDVSVYEEKKHKALLELNKVEEKLQNASIILKERKTYLNELKKDRDQALKFKGLKDQIDSYKATSLHLQMEDRNKIKAKHDGVASEHQDHITAAEKKIQFLKTLLETHKTKVSDINKQIEQKGEKEQVKVHKGIEDLKVKLAEEKTRISTLKDEINKVQQRKDVLRKDLAELEEKSSASGKEQKELEHNLKVQKNSLQDWEGKISEFKKKHKIETSQELEKDLEDKDKLIEQKQEDVQKIRQQQQEFLREKDRIEYQLQTLDERIRKVKEVEKESKGQIKQLQDNKSDFKRATLRLNQLLDQDSSYASQLGNARRKISELQEKHMQLNARTMTMQAGLAANKAVKSIIDNKKKFKGVFGTVAELGQVQKKFATALERAAGGKMQHLIVDDDETAAECIKYLKNSKLGSASFIPLNKIKSRQITAEDKGLTKKPGVNNFAINCITYKPQFRKAFEFIFGNTLIVDDMDSARKVGIGRIKMATLDGSIAESSGVMKGGFFAQRSMGFKEQDSLDELEKISQDMEDNQKVISAVEHSRDANEKEISSLRTKKGELEGEIIKLEKSLHLETGDLDVNSEAKKELQKKLTETDQGLSTVQSDVSKINRELVELKSKKQMLRTQVSQLRDPRLLAQMTAFEESRQKCRDDILRMETELKGSSSKMSEMIAPEHEKIQEIIKQHDKEEAQFTAEIKKLTATVGDREKDLVEKEKASKEFYSKYHGLFAEREKLAGEMNKAENETENFREKIRTHEREMNLVSLKNAEVKAKLAGLEEEFEKYKSAEILSGKSLEELQKEINKFEVMLAQMSAVNMKALEVYEQVESEFQKLLEKRAGLDTEKTEVLAFMNEIETKKKDHFMKTFNHANENFQKIFTSLFKKGKAHLQLNNPNNPFEDGLSIKVKLTGNKFMDIRSLSGGEKTLTALSFIFAIQEYQPASFYILDEIDAALDKHNSETLAKIIRSYADKAQYLIISHNDALISEADTLFGVSMNDGVSKITSLKI
jgi:chromosome segregation protein